MYTYMHLYICEKLFPKAQSLNLALPLQAHFLEWRLRRFRKELFTCTKQLIIIYIQHSERIIGLDGYVEFTYIYIYIYIFLMCSCCGGVILTDRVLAGRRATVAPFHPRSERFWALTLDIRVPLLRQPKCCSEWYRRQPEPAKVGEARWRHQARLGPDHGSVSQIVQVSAMIVW